MRILPAKRLYLATIAASIFLLQPLFPGGSIFAQNITEGDSLTWADFIDNYLNGDGEETETEERIALFEELHRAPLDVNAATRSELLLLPFVTEAQADSLIAYRERKGGLRSLGELMFVPGWQFDTRHFFHLFATCAPPAAKPRSLWQRLKDGKHTLETRLDVPLYKRDAYKPIDRAQYDKNPNSVYWGNNMRNVLRYRYEAKGLLRLGLTADKDGGEPFARLGNRPYDYLSGYAEVGGIKGLTCYLGDYEVRFGLGLAAGNALYATRSMAAGNPPALPHNLRPHTSTEECRYLRGAGLSYQHGHWHATAFASLRRLDARLEGDTVRSILTTGLHRTLREMERKRNLRTVSAGGSVGFRSNRFQASLNGAMTHFALLYSPELRTYTADAFRGTTCGNASLDYAARLGRWLILGETALDQNAHIATRNIVRFAHPKDWSLQADIRHFSPGYFSFLGQTLQQASSLTNETGLMLSAAFRAGRRGLYTAYIDLFRFPHPVYRASQASNGLELQAQGEWAFRKHWQLLARYRFKARQYDISGYKPYMEYVQKHRARLQAGYTDNTLQVRGGADLTLAASQTEAATFGWLCYLRGAYAAGKHWRVGGFGAVFFTDGFDSAVYAYDPQLPHAAAFSSFYYHGMKWTALAAYRPAPWLSLALRLSSLRYFNRSEQSSGPDRIASAWKNDISVQVSMKI